MKKYSEKDFVRVVDGSGSVLPDPVPEAWVGTDLLPPGSKKATRAQVDKAEDPAPDTGETSES